MLDRTEFSLGQMVFLKSDPSKKGAVVGVLPGQPENRVVSQFEFHLDRCQSHPFR